jgi:hypothetical protein
MNSAVTKYTMYMQQKYTPSATIYMYFKQFIVFKTKYTNYTKNTVIAKI